MGFDMFFLGGGNVMIYERVKMGEICMGGGPGGVSQH